MSLSDLWLAFKNWDLILLEKYFLSLETDLYVRYGKFSAQRTFSGSNKPESSESYICLLYTSPSPRDRQKSRMPSSA